MPFSAMFIASQIIHGANIIIIKWPVNVGLKFPKPIKI